MISESDSTVARAIFSTQGSGIFPYTVVEQEFFANGETQGFAEIAVDTGKIEIHRDQLHAVKEQVDAAIKWFWENYPEAEGAQMQAPQVPEYQPAPAQRARFRPMPQDSYQPTPEIRQAIQQQPAVPAALASTVWPIPDDDDRTSPTTKQVQFAQRLTKDLHMDDNAIENFAMQEFQELPDAMDRQTFSKLIDRLKGMTGAPQQPARPAPPR